MINLFYWMFSCTYTTCMQCPWRPQEGMDPLGLELQQAVSLPYRCQKLRSNLEEQPMLLTAETSLLPPTNTFSQIYLIIKILKNIFNNISKYHKLN